MNDKEIQKFSRDYDMTLLLRGTLFLLGGYILLLVSLEVASMAFSNKDYVPKFLSSELIHSTFGYIGGVYSTIAAFLYSTKFNNNGGHNNGHGTND